LGFKCGPPGTTLRQQVDRFATGLIALGLVSGDRVGLWSPNRIEWVLSQYATAKAGLILVNLNPGYRVAELEYALNKVECRALICADQDRGIPVSASRGGRCPGIRRAGQSLRRRNMCVDPV